MKQLDKRLDRKPNGNTARRKIDLAEAVKLHFLHGESYVTIGRRYNVCKQAVHIALKPFKQVLQDGQMLQAYNEHYVQILQSGRNLLIHDLLDPVKRREASLNNVAYAFDKVSTHLRLEQGRSTANLDVHGIARSITKDEARLAELDQVIAELSTGHQQVINNEPETE